MKIHPDNFKISRQINVRDFCIKHVPKNIMINFKNSFNHWDNSLFGVSISNMPSYDEGVCWLMLNEAYGN